MRVKGGTRERDPRVGGWVDAHICDVRQPRRHNRHLGDRPQSRTVAPRSKILLFFFWSALATWTYTITTSELPPVEPLLTPKVNMRTYVRLKPPRMKVGQWERLATRPPGENIEAEATVNLNALT